MDKLQMAMRFAEIMLIEHFKGNGVYNSYGYKDGICEDAWVMADAMQAEADKRNKAEAEEKRKYMRELLNAGNSIVGAIQEMNKNIKEDGQKIVAKQKALLDDVEWQPDWSQAPDGFDWWAIDKDGLSYFYNYKPYITADYWGDSDLLNDDCVAHECDITDYQGNWQDSLRKRPQ